MAKASDERSTPQEFFDAYNRDLKFDLDVAATAENAKCKAWISKGQDALKVPWRFDDGPARVWCNPPYSELTTGKRRSPWLEKAWNEWRHGNCQCIAMLLPADTSTNWFHDHVWNNGIPRLGVRVVFIKGRLNFTGEAGAKFPSMLVTWH